MNAFKTAIERFKQGKMVILSDDHRRENEGDLIFAAEFAKPEHIRFMLAHTCGVICLSLTEAKLNQLNLNLAPRHHTAANTANFTLSIDAACGITTGVSAFDRAKTIQTVMHPNAKPSDLATPGHLFPLQAHQYGVLARGGHTEGSTDLAKIAGLQPAAVICEIMNTDGTVSKEGDLQKFSKQYDIPIISTRDIMDYRWQHEAIVKSVAQANLPTHWGELSIHAFYDPITQAEAIALTKDQFTPHENCITRVHSSCITGDLLDSLRCDCGDQLKLALQKIVAQNGILIYLQQEGRGIGLSNKIKAYALQDQGLDTVDANLALGFEADERNFAMASQILKHLKIPSVQLLTNNLEKVAQLRQYGTVVTQHLNLQSQPTKENSHYLKTKRDRLSHLLSV